MARTGALIAATAIAVAASGLDCKPSYLDDLYVVALTSSDGETYGGRITEPH